MTLPHEEKRALKQTRDFLGYILTDLKHPVKLKDLRERAKRCYHHYPFECKIDSLYEGE